MLQSSKNDAIAVYDIRQ